MLQQEKRTANNLDYFSTTLLIALLLFLSVCCLYVLSGLSKALQVMDQHKEQLQYPAYIGLDVHKNTIARAVAKEGRQEPEYRGEIANWGRNITKLVERLTREFGGEVLLW